MTIVIVQSECIGMEVFVRNARQSLTIELLYRKLLPKGKYIFKMALWPWYVDFMVLLSTDNIVASNMYLGKILLLAL